MHITPFGEKKFHLKTLLAISMAECLVANKILYCIVLYCTYSLSVVNLLIVILCLY